MIPTESALLAITTRPIMSPNGAGVTTPRRLLANPIEGSPRSHQVSESNASQRTSAISVTVGEVVGPNRIQTSLDRILIAFKLPE